VISDDQVADFQRVLHSGGVALFPADTVYGLGCEPGDPGAIERMYSLKKREEGRPSAVMFFSLDRALASLPGLGERTSAAIGRLLPGPITVVLPDPGGPLSSAAGELGLGVRVPRLEGALAALARLPLPVLQTSANPSGAADAARLSDVDTEIRSGVDIVLDGGELRGLPSSVVDLTRYEQTGDWRLLRESALSADAISKLMDA
jgi:L-threonylcarbamoyladenylate synthase